MRAATVTEYGATPGVAEIPTPEPGEGQILIRLRAAGMNPMDLWLASGAWKPMPATFPMVLGADGAGVVEKLGEGCRADARIRRQGDDRSPGGRAPRRGAASAPGRHRCPH